MLLSNKRFGMQVKIILWARPVEGYERPVVILTEAGAKALAAAQATMPLFPKTSFDFPVR